MSEKKPKAATPAATVSAKTASLRAELMSVAAMISDRGMDVLIHHAEGLAKQYPRVHCHVLAFQGGRAVGSRQQANEGGVA